MVGLITNYNPRTQVVAGIVTVEGEEREFEKVVAKETVSFGDTIQVSLDEVKEINAFEEPELGGETYQDRNW
jgi:hypothetical protein